MFSDKDLLKSVSDLKEIVAGCVKFGDFTLASGKKSDFYFDGRLVTFSAKGARLIGQILACAIRNDEEGATHVGGPAIGAVPIATAVSYATTLMYPTVRQLDTFVVRKEAKAHGTGNQIEGPPLGPESRVVVVEDVVTSGGSVLRAIEAIKATGATVLRCIALLDREEGAQEAFEAAGVKLVSVFRRSDFLKV